jgi:hypothetical protein
MPHALRKTSQRALEVATATAEASLSKEIANEGFEDVAEGAADPGAAAASSPDD